MFLRQQLDMQQQQSNYPGQTNVNFNVIPEELKNVNIEESLGNLDVHGTTTSHFMKGGFDPNKS